MKKQRVPPKHPLSLPDLVHRVLVRPRSSQRPHHLERAMLRSGAQCRQSILRDAPPSQHPAPAPHPGPSNARPFVSNPPFQTLDCKSSSGKAISTFTPTFQRLPSIELTCDWRCNYFTPAHKPAPAAHALTRAAEFPASLPQPHPPQSQRVAPPVSLPHCPTRSLSPHAQIVTENTTVSDKSGLNCSPRSLLPESWRQRLPITRNPCFSWLNSHVDLVQADHLAPNPPPLLLKNRHAISCLARIEHSQL